jgi:PKD repeat protein
VQFTNASSPEADQFFWSFGDGETSEEENPVYTYTATGNYYFNLTITDSTTGCSHTFGGYVYVTVEIEDSQEFNGTDDPVENTNNGIGGDNE